MAYLVRDGESRSEANVFIDAAASFRLTHSSHRGQACMQTNTNTGSRRSILRSHGHKSRDSTHMISCLQRCWETAGKVEFNITGWTSLKFSSKLQQLLENVLTGSKIYKSRNFWSTSQERENKNPSPTPWRSWNLSESINAFLILDPELQKRERRGCLKVEPLHNPGVAGPFCPSKSWQVR